MSLVDIQGIDLSKLEKVVSAENVDCGCFPAKCRSKCCFTIKVVNVIKEKSKSFIRYISGEKVEELKP
jgi:hypothetical protein